MTVTDERDILGDLHGLLEVDGTLATTYWTARKAAAFAGVSINTIRQWVYRGHLHQAVDERDKPLTDDEGLIVYRASDVINAERKTRTAARRTPRFL